MTTSGSAFLSKLSKLRLGGPARDPRPHKPLLLLLVLSRAEHGRATRVTYAEVVDELTPLLVDYAGSTNVHQPFWRLQHDDVWEIQGASDLPTTAKGDVLTAALTDEHAGDFPRHYADLVQRDASIRKQAINIVADRLPSDVRDDVLRRLGLR